MSRRPAIAFTTSEQAIADAAQRSNCEVITDQHPLPTYWSVPTERLDEPGPWRRGAHVDTDPTPPAGTQRPGPYDWAVSGI